MQESTQENHTTDPRPEFKSKIVQRLYNIALATDQWFSALAGYPPDTSISGVVGRYTLAGKNWARPFGYIPAWRWALDKIFGKDHCVNAIDWGEELGSVHPLPSVIDVSKGE